MCFIMVLAIFMTEACDDGRVFDDNISLSESGWDKDFKPSFAFDIGDTTALYNILINVRNESDYAYSNLYLFVKMTSPSAQYFMDTVEVKLADKGGRWLGSGIGNIWQVSSPLLKGVRLKERGEYRIEFTHGMRTDVLEDIRNIGVRVEHAGIR